MSLEVPDYQNMFRLDGRTVFLSGAAGHLGRAMTFALAQAGAHVILNGRTASKLESLHQELAEAGFQSTVAAFDIMDHGTANAFLEGLDRLDILINNAISAMPNKDDVAGEGAFAAALNSGVTAAYENVLSAMSALEAAVAAVGQASVINVTSIYGHVAPIFSVYGDTLAKSPARYSAAKGGLLQLTRYLACDLAPRNIRVNSLSPGIFPWDSVVETDPGFVRRVSDISPMRRPGQASEIGGPTVFLACDASSYMTGADLLIDGGWVAQ